MEIVFVTGNKNKFSEAEKILRDFGIVIKRKKIYVEEIQELDVSLVAKRKAEEAYRELGMPLIVEDTGIEVKGMNGYPGALVKHFYEAMTPHGMVEFLRKRDSRTTGITAVAYFDGKTMKVFEGRIEGRIAGDVRGGDSFDWDSFFIPEGYGKTYSQLGIDEKNKISQRRKALEKFAEWFLSHSSPGEK